MDSPVIIRLPTCALEALLLYPERKAMVYNRRSIERYPAPIEADTYLETTTGCPNGHRGVWFYDPATVGKIVQVGEAVDFDCDGEIVLRAVVKELARPQDYPKMCSRNNHQGFLWVERASVDSQRPDLADVLQSCT